MNRIVTLTVAAAMAIGGTAWAQGAKPAKPDFKQLEGTWEGVARTLDGLPYPIRTDISEDGKARHAAPSWLPGARVTTGTVTLQKDPKTGIDIMHYASGQDDNKMLLDVDVVDGRRVLRLTRPDGSIVELFERTETKKR